MPPDRGSHWQVFDLGGEAEDAGYGGMVYDDKNQDVAILYHENHREAVLKQYKFRIAGATNVKLTD